MEHLCTGEESVGVLVCAGLGGPEFGRGGTLLGTDNVCKQTNTTPPHQHTYTWLKRRTCARLSKHPGTAWQGGKRAHDLSP